LRGAASSIRITATQTIMPANTTTPPGKPGIPSRWTSSAKSGVGTAIGATSRLWFTLSHGIVNEIYTPRIDRAAIRDLGLIVTNGRDFFSEEKRDARHEIATVAEGAPAFRLVNTCRQGRYRLEKEIFADPRRETLLHIRFTPYQGRTADYHLYALLAPHLNNQGQGNTAWIGACKGVPMLFAQRGDQALALAAGRPEQAAALLRVLVATVNDSGLLPEQVWDTTDVAGKELFFGRATGSAMPPVWAHKEVLHK
jgi:glucoamylase